MLKHLKLENFKCFARAVTVPLAPITLIYGPNSGGKSSIIQSLVLMRQTLDRGPGTTALVPRGDLVDLGSFKSFVHGHSLKNRLKRAVTATPFRPVSGERSLALRHLGYHEVGMELTLGAAKSRGSRRLDSSKLLEATYSLRELRPPRPIKGSQTVVTTPRSMHVTLEPTAKKLPSFIDKGEATAWELTAESTDTVLDWIQSTPMRQPLDSSLVRQWLESSVIVSEGLLPARMVATDIAQLEGRFPSRAAGLHVLRRAFPLDDMTRTLERAFLRLSYLGPLRMHPARYYDLTSASADTVGKTGENAPQVIFRRGNKVTKEINRWFDTFEVPYKLRAKQLGDEVTGHILAITLVDQRTGVVVGPSDVGFGIGQLLPIIVEGVVSEGKTICVEQPEIHLHPRLQAHVADLLIETAGIHDDPRPGAPCGTQWIVETHSEALVLRLQRRIREGALRSKHVSVLYVEPTTAGSLVHQLRLAEDGDFIDDWPDGFFEESFDELFSSEGAT